MGDDNIEAPQLRTEKVIQVPTYVVSTLVQEEKLIGEPTQQGEISKPCVVDLIQ